MKKKESFVYITEKMYLSNGAWGGKKKILRIEANGELLPFRQLDEYGRFEILTKPK